jgi:hypothetical protein
MKFKLFATAVAMLGAISAAQAADLAKKAPAAVDYVKVCDAYGEGFFYIPGGETCLKIGGFVRARAFVGRDNAEDTATLFRPVTNYTPFAGNGGRDSANYTTEVQASIEFDARSNTEFGLLRAFVDVRPGNADDPVDKAFLQFGGLTAGYASSAFNYFVGNSLETTYEPFWSDHSANLISYTHAFGNGISATLSIEDAATGDKRNGLSSALLTTGKELDLTVATETTFSGFYATYGGNRVPDVVANLNITQAWGDAQLSLAAHQNYDEVGVVGEKWGYAAQAGATINLPMLGDGNTISLIGGYTQGAIRYLGLSGLAADYLATSESVVDGGAVTSVTYGSLDQTTAWSINGGYLHVFSPSVSFAIDVGYADVDQAGANDFAAINASSTLYWTPVSGLEVNLGLEYQSVDFSSATAAAYQANSTTGTTALGDTRAWVGLLEIKRTF